MSGSAEVTSVEHRAGFADFMRPHIDALDNATVRVIEPDPNNLDALRAECDDTLVGLMLTNPNTLGLFDEHVLEVTRIVHEAGASEAIRGAAPKIR